MTQENENPVELIQRAEQALVNEEWAAALLDFDEAIAGLHRPTEPPTAHLAEAYNGRGAALLQMGRYNEAIEALRRALEYQPDLAGAFFNLGLCYEALNDSESALAAYDQALALAPNDAEFYFRRGGVHFVRQEFQQTVEDTTRAIELHPDEAVTGPYIARGLAYFQLEQYDKAQADFGAAVEADPRGAAEAYFYRALTFIDMADALSARADLEAFLLMTDDPNGPMGVQAKEIIEELEKIQ
jgi:tetratricopeptide (TPR) repeat protein